MGQFDALSVSERQQLIQAWVTEGHKVGLYIVAHVGDTVQSNAITLANYAKSVGADAIVAVPPFYEIPDLDSVIQWFIPIAAAGAPLPFFYYHIPGSTHVELDIYDLLQQGSAAWPTFAGVKNVDSNQMDFFNAVLDYGSQYYLMWAPEPKLQSFLFSGNGTILAESFYGGTFLRMWDAFVKGDYAGAMQEQRWKYNVDNIFAKYAGVNSSNSNAKRAVYQTLCNINMSPYRQPDSSTYPTGTDYTNMISELTAAGFFNQTIPPFVPLSQ